MSSLADTSEDVESATQSDGERLRLSCGTKALALVGALCIAAGAFAVVRYVVSQSDSANDMCIPVAACGPYKPCGSGCHCNPQGACVFVPDEPFMPGFPYPPRQFSDSAAGGENVPANYGRFSGLPSGTSTDIQIDHMWTRIPSPSEMTGNAIFSSTQFWLAAAQSAGQSGGAGAYAGSQVLRPGTLDSLGRQVKSGEETMVVFSVWDMPGTTVRWNGSSCGRFGGEGVGSHCLLKYPLVEGVKYTVKVLKVLHDGSGDHWQGIVTDTSTGKETVMGTLILPNAAGYEGYGDIDLDHDPPTIAFQEWWEATGCEGQAVGSAVQYGPFFQQRAVRPNCLTAGYKESECTTSDVTACVPGDGCGEPRLHMTGGGSTQRTTENNQELWNLTYCKYTPPTLPPCHDDPDKSYACAQGVEQGDCRKNSTTGGGHYSYLYMLLYCQRTCNLCDVTPPTCYDDPSRPADFCPGLAAKGACKPGYPGWPGYDLIKNWCPKTCGFCH